MIKTTKEQGIEIRKQIQKEFENLNKNKPSHNEKLWTYYVACIIDHSQVKRKEEYLRMFVGTKENIESISEIWFEAQPIPPRKGFYGKSEGNTKLDLAFGGIRQRSYTQTGIEYDSFKDWVCFVEAKFLSDCSGKTSYDPFRNQLARVIENMICFQNEKGERPKRYIFSLLTPRKFRNAENRKTRLFGYKYEDYHVDRAKLLDDIKLGEIAKREDSKWEYPQDFNERVKNKLSMSWVAYEEIIEKELGIEGLDVIEPGKHWQAILEKMKEYLKE